MSFPQGLFWATAEKLIFKYMKYAMQHEKKKQISWKQVSFPPPYSHSQSLLYQNSRQKRETHPYWNPLMWVRTKKKKGYYSVFSPNLLICCIFPNVFSLTEKSDSHDFSFHHIQIFAPVSLYPWDLPGSL